MKKIKKITPSTAQVIESSTVDVTAKVGQAGVCRNDMPVKIAKIQGSFFVVETESGNRFTIHALEFIPKGGKPNPVTATWPRTNLIIRLEKLDGALHPSLLVFDMPKSAEKQVTFNNEVRKPKAAA